MVFRPSILESLRAGTVASSFRVCLDFNLVLNLLFQGKEIVYSCRVCNVYEVKYTSTQSVFKFRPTVSYHHL